MAVLAAVASCMLSKTSLVFAVRVRPTVLPTATTTQVSMTPIMAIGPTGIFLPSYNCIINMRKV